VQLLAVGDEDIWVVLECIGKRRGAGSHRTNYQEVRQHIDLIRT
jgi:hypothetical protein